MSNPLYNALQKKDVDLFHQLIQQDPNLVYQHLNLDIVVCLKSLNYPYAESFIQCAFSQSEKASQSQLTLTIEYAVHKIGQLLLDNQFEAAFNLIKPTIHGYRFIKTATLASEINLFSLFFSAAYYHFYTGNIERGIASFNAAFQIKLGFPVLLADDTGALIFRAFSFILPKLPAEEVNVEVYRRYLSIMRDTLESRALGENELSVKMLLELLHLFETTLNSIGRDLNLAPFTQFLKEKVNGPTLKRIRLWDIAIIYISRLIKTHPPKQSEGENYLEAERCRMLLTIFNMIADIQFEGQFGCDFCLLTLALARPHTLHIAKVLVNRGATLDLAVPMSDGSYVSLISLVCTVGNLPGVQFLLEQGVDPNSAPSTLITALLSERQDIALYLAAHEKVDVNRQRGGLNPLLVATGLKNREVVKVLRARGAVMPDTNSQSPGNVISDFKYRPSMSAPILAPTPVRPTTPSVILTSQQEQDPATLRRTLNGHIRKQELAFLRLPDMKRFILSAESVDPKTGYHPIHTACEYGANKVIECLVKELGVPVNVRNARDYTALHMACESNRHTTIAVLVECGAATRVKTLMDMTPEDLADKKGKALLAKSSAKPVALKSGAKAKIKNGTSHQVMRPAKPQAAVVEKSASHTPTRPKTPELVFPEYQAPAKLIPVFKAVHQCLWRIRECQRFYKNLPDSTRWNEHYKRAVSPLIRDFFLALQAHHDSTLETRMIPYPLLEDPDALFPDLDRFQTRCHEYLLDFFATKLSLTQQDRRAKQILEKFSEEDVRLCTEEWVDGLLKSCEDSHAPLCDLSGFLHPKSNGNCDDSMVKSRLC